MSLARTDPSHTAGNALTHVCRLAFHGQLGLLLAQNSKTHKGYNPLRMLHAHCIQRKDTTSYNHRLKEVEFPGIKSIHYLMYQ